MYESHPGERASAPEPQRLMCFKTPALSREAKAHLFGTSYQARGAGESRIQRKLHALLLPMPLPLPACRPCLLLLRCYSS